MLMMESKNKGRGQTEAKKKETSLALKRVRGTDYQFCTFWPRETTMRELGSMPKQTRHVRLGVS
jgi:hypothetical protein